MFIITYNLSNKYLLNIYIYIYIYIYLYIYIYIYIYIYTSRTRPGVARFRLFSYILYINYSYS